MNSLLICVLVLLMLPPIRSVAFNGKYNINNAPLSERRDITIEPNNAQAYIKMNFRKTKYNGEYNNWKCELILEDLILENADSSVKLKLDPASYDSYFNYRIQNPNVEPKTITVRTQYNDIVFENVSEKFKIIAYNDNDPNIETSAEISLKNIPVPIVDGSIKFNREYYHGTFDNQQLTINLEVIIVDGHLEEEVELKILPGDLDGLYAAKLFEPKIKEKQVTFSAKTKNPINIDVMLFYFAVRSGTRVGYATIILDIVHGVTTPSPYHVHFKEHTRTQKVLIDDLPWVTMRFVAYSDDPKDHFTYSIENQIPNVPHVRINTKTGQLYVDSGLSLNVYKFTINAVCTLHFKQASTSFVLVIEKRPEDNYHEKVPYSHIVRHVLEDQTQEVLLLGSPTFPGLNKEYGYCISSLYPDIPAMFRIDEYGNVISRTLLRETKYFKDMSVPQFTVTVQMIKLRDLPEDGFCRSNNMPLMIEGNVNMINVTIRTDLTTVISVIIDDINNQSPLIKEHTLTVCYPTKELLPHIRPPYMTKVKATDLDSLENGYGKITFIPGLGSDLEVNPTTGEVYPTSNIYSRIGTNVIRAIDGNEGRHLHYDDIYITHKIIDEKYIGVLTLEKRYEEVEDFLEKISKDDVIVRPLNIGNFYQNIPIDEESKATRRTLEVIIYAVKEDVPLTITETEKFLADSEVTMVRFAPFKLDEPTGKGNFAGKMKADNMNLFAAITVLAVLCICS